MFHTLLRQMSVGAHNNGVGLDPRYFEVMLKDLVLLHSSHLIHVTITLPKTYVITNGNPKAASVV
jgi:hypothetical protein